MKRISVLTAIVLAVLVGGVAQASPSHNVVYNAIPGTLPPNMASLGFQATQTAEFGDYVNLGGTARTLKAVTVTLSDWALYSDYASDARYSGNSATWTHPITINVYRAVPGATPADPNTAGPLLGTVTKNVTIPWRPAGPACPTDVTAWMASDGQCYHGLAFNAKIDMRGLHVRLPDDVIVGVAYNTNTWGSNPIGSPGPYESLNVGLEGAATVGTDVSTDNVFWNTMTAASYTDLGAAGVGIFREDTNWTPYGTVAIKITASGPSTGHKGHGHENNHNDDGHHDGGNVRDR